VLESVLTNVYAHSIRRTTKQECMRIFIKGFKAMLPIITGVIPFGAVMGTVSADAKLTMLQTISMNILVFAGSAQLAAVDMMSNKAAAIVIIITGLIINLRFMLYSAAISPVIQSSKFLVKLTTAYFLTDQTYSVMNAHQSKLKNNSEVIAFYFGAAICMALTWHFSVIAGHAFGNFAPSSWALDYAVPLSFIALVIPTLKNKKYVYVTIFSSVLSVLLKPMPFNLGLIVTALLAISFAAYLTKSKARS
jgi:predicted branched-subunit amino acid permease